MIYCGFVSFRYQTTQISLNLNHFLRVKPISQMLSVRNVNLLIGCDFCLANLSVDISMRMSVNPIVNTRIGNVIT